MFLPLPRRRNPSNRECRVASIICACGMLAFGWMTFNPPQGLVELLGEVAALVIVFWLGLGTLLYAKPHQLLFWPQLKVRLGLEKSSPPLDEREHYIRYRTFLISYQALFLTLFALMVLPGLLGPRVMQGVYDRFRTYGPLDLGLLILARLMILALVLPHLVLPWVESDPPPDAETDLEASSSLQDPRQSRSTKHWWVPLLRNVLVWGIALAVMLWIFDSKVPGGLRGMWG
jgi:hypothetical protein